MGAMGQTAWDIIKIIFDDKLSHDITIFGRLFTG